MRSLPVPGADRRRQRRQEVLYAATAERLVTFEKALAENEDDMTRIRAGWSLLRSMTKGDTR